jgi:hypothetical protein
VLREGLSRKYLVQVPVVMQFGVFIDMAMFLMTLLPLNGYLRQMAAVVVGSAILGMGIAFQVVCEVSILFGEGLGVAIACRARLLVGNMKMLFDCGHVAFAAVVSLIFAGDILGLREGTVFSALSVGSFVRLSWPQPSEPCGCGRHERRGALPQASRGEACCGAPSSRGGGGKLSWASPGVPASSGKAVESGMAEAVRVLYIFEGIYPCGNIREICISSFFLRPHTRNVRIISVCR